MRPARRALVRVAGPIGAAVLAVAVATGTAQSVRQQEWPVYAADAGATHYSPLTDIDRTSVRQLGIAWEWKPGEENLPQFGTRPGNFENTPIMIDDVLYVSTMYNRVVALNAESGAQLWAYDPRAYEDGQPPNGTGFVHRGVAAWRDGGRLRIFINSRYRLMCLDARTGEPIETFGTQGVVDLTKGLRWTVNPRHYTSTSPPVVYKNLVIVGNGVGDRLTYRNDPPGDVRAFDARTGAQVWTFHTVPGQRELGHETWDDASWRITGHTNVWAPMSLDEARGLLFLPVSTPSNDFYGGRRRGQNLFADSIVCLDAATGRRKWHFQVAHHGLWDYDPAAAPALVRFTVAGRGVDAVVLLTKQGFAFVFDRTSGVPVWPIEERAVPPSEVAGEQAWPTQPFPTRPGAIAAQGAMLDDAFDLTPALRAAAQNEMQKYRLGPLYTPPSIQGTLQRPGIIGGANWGGSAFDPETGRLYVKVTNQAAVARIVVPDRSASNPRAGEVDAEYIGDVGSAATFMPSSPGGASRMPSLPLFKPPYGELVAIDLGKGTIAWRAAFGDTPSIRSHPLLKDVPLPDRLGASGAHGVMVTKSGLVVGGADTSLYVFDALTGREIWKLELPRRPSATPMTYRTRSGRQFIVIATGSGNNASLVALTRTGKTTSGVVLQER